MNTVERAHAYLSANAAESGADALIAEMADEIERLRADNERLRAALEPFQRNVKAISLSSALGHISRDDLWKARNVYESSLQSDE